MDWLHPFIVLALCCGTVTTLLPQGSLKKTAGLVIGLLLTLCWTECVLSLLELPSWPGVAGQVLIGTGYDYETALASLAHTLGGE